MMTGMAYSDYISIADCIVVLITVPLSLRKKYLLRQTFHSVLVGTWQ